MIVNTFSQNLFKKGSTQHRVKLFSQWHETAKNSVASNLWSGPKQDLKILKYMIYSIFEFIRVNRKSFKHLQDYCWKNEIWCKCLYPNLVEKRSNIKKRSPQHQSYFLMSMNIFWYQLLVDNVFRNLTMHS